MTLSFSSWTLLITIIDVIVVILTLSHILLHNTRPAFMLGWAGVVLFAPFIGALFYFTFGLSRVRRRAARLESYRTLEELRSIDYEPDPEPPGIPEFFRIGNPLTAYQAHPCDEIVPYLSPDQAYKAMLTSIREAQHSVDLLTYIFDADHIGLAFVRELSAAQQRGVSIRVIVDGVGALNQWLRIPPIYRALNRHQIPFVKFMPPSVLPPSFSINLRNHRKMLIIDSDTVFTGGLNISQRYSNIAHALQRGIKQTTPGFDAAISDLHFRFQGCVADQYRHIFNSDWAFAKGFALPSYAGEQSTPESGYLAAWTRTISDTPSDSLNRFAALFHSVVSRATKRIAIVTPYFIPSSSLLDAMQTAALYGVDISIYLPETLDQRLVQWARMHIMRETIESGTKVYFRQGPFSHDKLLLIDDHYAFIGSPNWDPRSLMLNYEAGVECWSEALCQELWAYVDSVQANSQRFTLTDVDKLSILRRLRNGLAWTASSYL